MGRIAESSTKEVFSFGPGRVRLTTSSVMGFLAMLSVAASLPAAEPVAELPIEIIAIRDNGRSIVNGKVVARGTFQYESRGDQSPGAAAKSIECSEVLEFVFDFPAEKSSFRRARTRIQGEDLNHVDDFKLAGLVSTPGYSLQIAQSRNSPSPSVGVYNPIVDWRRLPRYLFPIVDLRVVSMVSYDGLPGPFSDVVGFLESGLFSVTDEGGGIRRLEAVDKDGFTYRYWSDEHSGFQIVRAETTRKEDARRKRGLPIRILSDSETSWMQKNGVWVPQSLSLRTESHGTTSRLQVSFDWQSLNEGVNDDDFRWETWNLPKGAFVVDQRLGRDRSIHLRDCSLPDEIELPAAAVITPGISRRLLILVNVVLLSFAAGWLLRSFLHRRRRLASTTRNLG